MTRRPLKYEKYQTHGFEILIKLNLFPNDDTSTVDRFICVNDKYSFPYRFFNYAFLFQKFHNFNSNYNILMIKLFLFNLLLYNQI